MFVNCQNNTRKQLFTLDHLLGMLNIKAAFSVSVAALSSCFSCMPMDDMS